MKPSRRAGSRMHLTLSNKHPGDSSCCQNRGCFFGVGGIGFMGRGRACCLGSLGTFCWRGGGCLPHQTSHVENFQWHRSSVLYRTTAPDPAARAGGVVGDKVEEQPSITDARHPACHDRGWRCSPRKELQGTCTTTNMSGGLGLKAGQQISH